jgi:hypothetical protein
VDENVFLAIPQPSLDTREIVGYEVYAEEDEAVKRQEIRRDTCKLVLNQEGKAFQDGYILRGAKRTERVRRFLVKCRPWLPKDSMREILV